MMVEALLDDQAEALIQKVIELALGGDLGALRLCLERLYPPQRERLVRFEMPTLKNTADAAEAISALIAAVANGELTPGEAGDLLRLVDGFVRAIAGGQAGGDSEPDPMATLHAHLVKRSRGDTG